MTLIHCGPASLPIRLVIHRLRRVIYGNSRIASRRRDLSAAPHQESQGRSPYHRRPFGALVDRSLRSFAGEPDARKVVKVSR
jgi:hypothetical protein